MASYKQQSLILGCHISFEAITYSGNKNIISNLLIRRDEALKVQDDYVLKDLEGLIIGQKDKKLYCRVGD